MGRQDELMAKAIEQATGASVSEIEQPPKKLSQDDLIRQAVETAGPAPHKQTAASPAAAQPTPSTFGKVLNAVEATGKFLDEKIDQPSRRLVGLPATGADFSKKLGIPQTPNVMGLTPANVAGGAYEMAASPLNLLAAGPRVAGVFGRLAGSKADKFAKVATRLQGRPLDLDIADAVSAAVPAIATAMGGEASLEKALWGLGAGIGTAVARRYAYPPAMKAASVALKGVGQVLGPKYIPALEKATLAGISATQMAKLAETSEGVQTLKVMLKDYVEKPEGGIIARLKKRNPSR
jgi:hypothetical protein